MGLPQANWRISLLRATLIVTISQLFLTPIIMTLKYIRFLLMLTIVGSLSSLPTHASVAQKSIVMVTSAQNTTQTLAKHTLRAIYSMKTNVWPDGKELVLVVLEDSAYLHKSFCLEVLGLLPVHLRRSWDRKIFSGRGTPPIVAQSPEEMIRILSNTEGAIGYISQDLLDEGLSIVEIK